MKKYGIYLIIILTLVNLVALGTMLFQRRIASGRQPRTEMRMSRFEIIRSELDLTPAQVARFEEIRFTFHSRLDSLNQTLEGSRSQLLEEIWLPQPSDTRIDSLINQINQVQMESQRLIIWHFYQFREELTPAQWQKFYGIVADRFKNPVQMPCATQGRRTEPAEEVPE